MKKRKKASADIRAKLRFVTKEIRENPDALGVVVMLANHGGVCHVMSMMSKFVVQVFFFYAILEEVGIRAAYAALASTKMESLDIDNTILELLHGFRELLVEKLYIAQELNGAKQQSGAPLVNTHNVITYRNGERKKKKWFGI